MFCRKQIVRETSSSSTPESDFYNLSQEKQPGCSIQSEKIHLRSEFGLPYLIACFVFIVLCLILNSFSYLFFMSCNIHVFFPPMFHYGFSFDTPPSSCVLCMTPVQLQNCSLAICPIFVFHWISRALVLWFSQRCLTFWCQTFTGRKQWWFATTCGQREPFAQEQHM